MEWLEQVYATIDERFRDEHLPRMLDLCRQPSIAATGEGIEACAEKVEALLRMIGCRDIHQERYVQSPLVIGRLDGSDKNAPTIVMYGMYDVQPPEPLEAWTVPPYAGVIKEVPPFGECVVARGIANSKGLLVSFIQAVQCIQHVLGSFPFNILFVVEGEEELGSASMPHFVQAHLAELQQTEGVFLNGPRQDEAGRPYTILGNKGILYLDLSVTGGDWGGPQTVDVHSAHAAWVGSPTWRLVQALNTMRQGDQILVEGFYDDLAPLAEADEALTRRMAAQFDEPMYLNQRLFADKFLGDLHGEAAMRQLLWQPTLNLDGFLAGYTGPATKTVLPHKASCKVDVRLVPPMTAERTLQRIRDHLDKHGYRDVEITVRQGTPWAKSDPTCLAARAAIEAMDHSGYPGGNAWPIYPGTGPAYVFTQNGLPYISYGLGQYGRIHAPDEFMTVKGLRENEKSCAAFLYYFDQLWRAQHPD